MSKISLDLIKQFITNSQPNAISKFKNKQEWEVWLDNTKQIFEITTIEDLNDFIDLVDFEKTSGKFYLDLYAKKLANETKDVNVNELNLFGVINDINLKVDKFKTHNKAKDVINKIIGSSLCGIFRTKSDEEVISVVSTETEYQPMFINYIRQVYMDYYQSKGINSHGLNEYTLRKILEYDAKRQNDMIQS